MFRFSLLALLIAETSAISADSKAGQSLLSKATLIEDGERQLQNDNNNGAGFVAGMHLKYTGCYNVYSMAGEGNGGGQGQNSVLSNEPVVTFTLGTKCNGGVEGKYAVNMFEFLDSYTESMMEEQEWECENLRENKCACNNAEDQEYCQNMCFQSNKMSYCIQNENGEQAFEVQRYLECNEMEYDNANNEGQGGNNKNGNWYYNADFPNWDGQFRIGPYCASDGKSILLGTFYDESCSIPAKEGFKAYENGNNGRSLPYHYDSLISTSACINCASYGGEGGGGGNGGNWYNMNPSEFCAQSYQNSAKCESTGGKTITYPVTSGCDFMNKFLPTLSSSSSPFAIESGPQNAAMLFAWIFGFSTVLFGAYSYFLYRKIKRGGPRGFSATGALA